MTNNKQKKIARETVAYIFAAVGALAFGYVSFFSHKISIWIAFLGVCVTLVGIAIYAHSKISAFKLYCSLVLITIISLVITIMLNSTNIKGTKNDIPPDFNEKDSLLTLLIDSIQRSKSYIAEAESIKIVSKYRIESAERYFQVENSPSIRAENLSVEIKPNKKVIYNTVLTNYGKTQAENIVLSNFFVYHTINSYTKFFLNNNNLIRIQDLYPSQHKTIINETEKEIDQQYYDLIMSKKLFLYNYGRIIYNDVSKKKYIYDYCTVYDVDHGQLFEIFNPIFSSDETK